MDDVNRFAFAIIESNRAFSTNAFIDNIEYNKTSTYNLDAFLGASSGQFGIVVTDVPKGVCEPLVDKAVIEYKVRVLPANTAESVAQISSTGLVYDSFHKDICINDVNDVVLFFGDTSTQCNKPDTSGYTPCTANADCCAEYFCAFENATDCTDDEQNPTTGSCLLVSDYGTGTGNNTKIVNGQKWVKSSEGMKWWSMNNWCQRQKRPDGTSMEVADAADLGCGDFVDKKTVGHCTDNKESGWPGRENSVLYFLQTQTPKWQFNKFWLNTQLSTSCYSYVIVFDDSYVTYNPRRFKNKALCH